MTRTTTQLLARLTGTAVLAFTLATSVAYAGFMASSFGTRQEGGNHYFRVPSSGTNDGISHDLTPGDWYAFRVRVKHADAQFPNLGWASDNFSPTANDIQICNDSGCEAAEINVGPENLDWSDADKITLLLEAKTCMLCGWQEHEVELP